MRLSRSRYRMDALRRLLVAARGQAVGVPCFCPAQRLPGMIDIKARPAQTAVL